MSESRPLSDEMFSQQFRDIGSIRTVEEIDERLGKIEAFKSLSGKLLSMYQNMDVTLRMELARRNLSATYIKALTASSYSRPAATIAFISCGVIGAKSLAEPASPGNT
jgi:hypothetical protein